MLVVAPMYLRAILVDFHPTKPPGLVGLSVAFFFTSSEMSDPNMRDFSGWFYSFSYPRLCCFPSKPSFVTVLAYGRVANNLNPRQIDATMFTRATKLMSLYFVGPCCA